MPAEDRDPRIDPHVGDILVAPGNLRLTVTATAPKLVSYSLVSEKPLYPIDSIPVACNRPLNQWVKIAKKAEVIHRAD